MVNMMNIHNEKPVQMVSDGAVAEMETLLLVDDEKAILELCRLFLGDMGYIVLTANSPYDAIRLAQDYSGKINMLITDIIMPVMNGLELAETLSSIRPDIKCVFISGYPPETIFTARMYERGVNFIQKPFKLKDFADRIHNILNN